MICSTQLIYVTTSFQRYKNHQIQLSRPSPVKCQIRQLPWQSVLTLVSIQPWGKPCRNEKNRLKCDSERFREGSEPDSPALRPQVLADAHARVQRPHAAMRLGGVNSLALASNCGILRRKSSIIMACWSVGTLRG